MKYPLISIVIATYNAERALGLVLDSIRKQSYPKAKIEILIIDGGSTDKTREISRKFNCKVYKNPEVDQVYGKFIGYKKAKGKYLLLLDSDEVLESTDSIKNKAESIINDPKVGAVISSGLKKPFEYPDINYYLNEFGDPFSFFMYRNSKDPNFFLKDLIKIYKKIYSDKKRVVFNFSNVKNPPFIELTAMNVMVNLEYIKNVYLWFTPLVFYFQFWILFI